MVEQSEMPKFLEAGRGWGQTCEDCSCVLQHTELLKELQTDFTAGSSNLTLHCRCVFRRLSVN